MKNTTDHFQREKYPDFWQHDATYWIEYFGSANEPVPNKAVGKISARFFRNFQDQVFYKTLFLFLQQFRSPLTLLLAIAVLLSILLGDRPGGLVMFSILLVSGFLGFIQEKNAGKLVEKLRALLALRSMVIRGDAMTEINSADVMTGDIIVIKAGDGIPADCIIVDSNELYMNESTLTGESFPVRKQAGTAPKDARLSAISNALWQGTNVISGTARAIAINTGENTRLENIRRHSRATVETTFEKGVKEFGYSLVKITLVLALLVLLVNILAHRPLMESAFFSLALAVGMAPELLPAVTTIAMSAGAKRMLRKNLIIKKLSSIQNLGEVNMLCSDKTGTVTEGMMKIAHFYDGNGSDSNFVKQLAVLNALHETGYANPIDVALKQLSAEVDGRSVKKTGEIPYDFNRKRLSVGLIIEGRNLLVTKGAFSQVKKICSFILSGETVEGIQDHGQALDKLFNRFGTEGYRVIAVAYKYSSNGMINLQSETDMIFAGFVLMNDPLKPGMAEAVEELNQLGVGLKIITGDNSVIAYAVAKELNIAEPFIVTGGQLEQTDNEALKVMAKKVDIFAEVEPLQKERIITALKHSYTVAYLGDGINDIAAIHAADTGISVSNAVDVAREAADLVLTNKDLGSLAEAIREGRKTFANTLKYIHISTGSTFGNMCSVAIASFFLPFLPMLPKQILFTNFLSDFPYLAIASDKVDEKELRSPGKWNLKLVRSYMFFFGIHSTVFDMITFFILLRIFHSNASIFQTGWLEVSVLSELCILFVIRTRLSVWKSLPAAGLLILSMAAALVIIFSPYLGIGGLIGLSPLSVKMMAVLFTILCAYVVTAGFLKNWFFKKYAG